MEALTRPHSDHWSCATGTQGIVGNVVETEPKERWVGIPHSPRTQHVFLPTGRQRRMRRKGHVDIQQTFFGCCYVNVFMANERERRVVVGPPQGYRWELAGCSWKMQSNDWRICFGCRSAWFWNVGAPCAWLAQEAGSAKFIVAGALDGGRVPPKAPAH